MGCRSGYLDEQSRQYVRELTEVLATRDLAQVKLFYQRWQDSMDLPPMPDNKRLEEDMHLMILELPGLSHLHRSSQTWLLERGVTVKIRQMNCGKHHEGGNGSCKRCK
jgi:hypothetical protein